MIEVIKGNIVQAPSIGSYAIHENSCLVLENGCIEGIYPELPARYNGVRITDYGDRIITQAYCDMHLHAPQYAMLGMGLDLPLIEWLNTYTFHTEAQFIETGYARRVYRKLAAELIANGTTRVVMFSSLHRASTLILMEELENAGVCGYVGKVNMDRNGTPNLQETTEQSKQETLCWLDECAAFTHVKPILTPRFTPSCTNELMEWLGKLAKERGLYVQSHLSENLAEMDWVKQLHPDCAQYWESYDKYGLFKDHTVMAHCVHSDEREQLAMKERNVVVAHCPDSNINLCSGLVPLREMLERGLWVTLGSDIAGGALLPMNQVMTAAIRMSNAKRIETNWAKTALSVSEAYYLATSSGARYFGDKDGFHPGNPLHAVVYDDITLPETRRLSVRERFERLMYLANRDNVVAVYSEGRRL